MYIDPMNIKPIHHRADLVRIAIQAMTERGLEPDFSEAVSDSWRVSRGRVKRRGRVFGT